MSSKAKIQRPVSFLERQRWSTLKLPTQGSKEEARGDVQRSLEYEVTGTSSAQARKDKHIQGIPWDRLNITRESYGRTRLEQYINYENIPLSGDAVDKKCKEKQKGGNYYEFFHNTKLVKATILHFQL
ncbi:WD40/YVTN repeat-like-containing domain-containing protein [Artemisia annua]|uniref:WD40/YVTN repeat-like-containing domain-containing protein n=1 Tax=Artemisia annua TaxID=35608 RepID=A0A2U1NXN2_ARTAN|nr:WD40/YVTN repeat-like-containing domain-containing protein [Artemisia annua]